MRVGNTRLPLHRGDPTHRSVSHHEPWPPQMHGVTLQTCRLPTKPVTQKYSNTLFVATILYYLHDIYINQVSILFHTGYTCAQLANNLPRMHNKPESISNPFLSHEDTTRTTNSFAVHNVMHNKTHQCL